MAALEKIPVINGPDKWELLIDGLYEGEDVIFILRIHNRSIRVKVIIHSIKSPFDDGRHLIIRCGFRSFRSKLFEDYLRRQPGHFFDIWYSPETREGLALCSNEENTVHLF